MSFFFNDTATTEIYTLSLHDALPISTTGTLAPLLAKAGDLSLGRWRRSNGGSASGSSPLRVSSERAQARDTGSAATSPAAAETSPRNLRRASGCGRGAGCCRSIANADQPQCRPGSSFEPLFDQMMYVSSAFMASESESIFTPSFGFSIHQLIMSRSVANLFICSWNLGNS